MGSGCLINIDVARGRELELQGRAIASPFFLLSLGDSDLNLALANNSESIYAKH